MGRPVISFELEQDAQRLPLSQRIARSVSRDLRRGRLTPGTKLPGSRQLAASLGVHRNTVLAAYEELEREGLVETRAATGTFIVDSASLSAPRSARRAQHALPLELASVPEVPAGRVGTFPEGALPMLGGVPDLRLLPRAALARAYRAALRDGCDSIEYGEPMGDARLLRALAGMLADRRAVSTGPGELLVTRGSQMALFLAARVLARPGSVIAVEGLGYPPAWEAFRQAGAELVALPVDRSGLDVEALEELCRHRSVAAVYLTPHHQYPTTVTLSAPRRLALLRLAVEKRMAIIEDDFDHEVQFVGRPVLPLASADEARVVIYVGTLSKVLAPGIRVGYVAAQAPIIDAMRRLRWYVDRQGDHTVERAVAYLIEDGELEAHVRRTRREYAERRDVLMTELRAQLGDVLSFQEPNGGLALWTKVQKGVAAEAWARAARERGVWVQTGQQFAFDGRARAFVRLGYARLNPEELRRAVKLLRQALPAKR